MIALGCGEFALEDPGDSSRSASAGSTAARGVNTVAGGGATGLPPRPDSRQDDAPGLLRCPPSTRVRAASPCVGAGPISSSL